MDQMWILIDGGTGLHVAWYFWLRVLDEANRSARYGTPFGLLLLEAETDAPAGKAPRLLEEAASAVPQAIRSTDFGGIIASGHVAVLLTHQTAESAHQARNRILERMAATAGHTGVRWKSHLLTYPEDAAEISQMLTTGWMEARDGASGDALRRPA
jgi:hypothetical protein